MGIEQSMAFLNLQSESEFALRSLFELLKNLDERIESLEQAMAAHQLEG